VILTETQEGVIPKQQIPIEVVVPNVECPVLVVVTPDGVDSMELVVVGAMLPDLHKDGRESMKMVEDGMEVLNHHSGTLMLHHLSFKMNVGKSLLLRPVNGLPTIAGKNPKGARRQRIVEVVTEETLAGKNRAKMIGRHLLPKTKELNWKCLARATPALTSINMKIFPWRRRVMTCHLTSTR
jgi:CRISPR/Cas system CMR subunit Cmr6 (Cas7 group RAMP superfamily)